MGTNHPMFGGGIQRIKITTQKTQKREERRLNFEGLDDGLLGSGDGARRRNEDRESTNAYEDVVQNSE